MLLQPGHRRDGLEGGTRRLSGLGRVVVKRQGLVIHQTVVVGHVHGVGQTIVVVARIRDQRPDLPRVDVGHDASRSAGIQRKLRRCKLHFRDLSHKELVRIIRAVLPEKILLPLIVLQDSLVIQRQAKLLSADNVAADDVPADQLLEFIVREQLLQGVIDQGFIDLRSTGVLTRGVESGGIHPVFRDSVVQELPETDGIRLPALIILRSGVDPVAVDHAGSVGGQHGVQIVHEGLLVVRKLRHVPRLRRKKLRPHLRDGAFPVCGDLPRDPPLHFAGFPGTHMAQGQNIVSDELIVGVLDGDPALCRVSPVRVRLIHVHKLCRQHTCQMLLQQVVNADLEIPVDGKPDIIARHRLRLALDLHNVADVVDVHGPGTLFSVEIRLHVFFDAGPSDSVCQ